MIYGSVCFEFDGQSWRCTDAFYMEANQILGATDSEVKCWPEINALYIRGMFKKMPKRGQFCSKPHRLLGA